MSQDLIKALEDLLGHVLHWERSGIDALAIYKAEEALSRHRSSVESVELPENGSLAFSYVRHCVTERMAGFNAALGNKKDDDGDALPEPYGYAWHTGRINGNGGYEASFGFSLDEPDALEAAPMYDATTVRSLIAAAVDRERELCNGALRQALSQRDASDRMADQNFMQARDWAKRLGEAESVIFDLVHSMSDEVFMHQDQREAFDAAAKFIDYKPEGGE